MEIRESISKIATQGEIYYVGHDLTFSRFLIYSRSIMVAVAIP